MTHTGIDQSLLPRFQQIDPNTIEIDTINLLTHNRHTLKQLLAQAKPYTWDNLFAPLEDMQDALGKFWAPISHLHSVLQSDALRAAYHKALPLITDYHTELSQNEALFDAITAIKNSPDFDQLDPAQQKIIDNEIRDFKLAGIHLPADKKARLAELQQELSKYMTQFSENLLDATNAWQLHFSDSKPLAGLPPQALQLAQDNAKRRKLAGYVLTLDYPSYSTAIKYLNDRDLRKTIYTAYTTRASELGPNQGKWDNTAIMEAILKIRHEIATITGFKQFADYSLATKMAKTPEEVLSFLNNLVAESKAMAEIEYAELAAEAKGDQISQLEAWDLAYYSEKLQLAKFDFTQEDFRPYFPIQKVLDGLFTIVNRLYGITVTAQAAIETWHPDAHFYTIQDEAGHLRGGFYIDLYARPNKRDGAWMDECRVRRRLPDNTTQLPVAFLTCNFMPPVNNHPALLTHDDVITLFHEFGHCLHHLLTKVNHPMVAGINGVPWDAVEFPSQFMENFCWEEAALQLIAGHYQTNAPFPHDLYEKMLAAKHFQTALQMLRQLEFALFDFRLHLEFDPKQSKQIQNILDTVRTHTSVIPTPDFNRFQHSFGHIFAGGYAAGYYSYKWAEVLSADAYAEFETHGIFDRARGRSFMENILEVGGVKDPMHAFIAFKGRKPSIDALLKQSGIAKSDPQRVS